MNKMLVIILLMSSFYIQQSHAQGPLHPSSCLTMDRDNRQWVMSSNYALTAMNQSFDACKKESRFPTTCRVVKESCDLFIKGPAVVEIKSQCTALDQLGNPWYGRGSNKHYQAALAAKAKCRNGSPLPDSCYVNLITCIKYGE